MNTHESTSIPSNNKNNRGMLRLVSTKDLSRTDWLDVRKRGIGSSDSSAAIGLNPYKSPLELWLEKTNRDQGLAKPNSDDDTAPVFWGVILEPVVASQYQRRTGNKVRKVNAVLQHQEHPWMLANIDREVIGSAEVQILECKTAGINGAKLWRDGVPKYVEVQVMHQLAVTGKQAADVAVLLGGQQLEVYRIERDEILIQKLIELEQQFWRYVETDTPPPADGSDSADQALRLLYPEDNGVVTDFSEDQVLSQAYTELKQVRLSLAELGTQESVLKQRLQEAMGPTTKAVFAEGSVTWKKAKDSVALDLDALLKARPELKTLYQTSKPGSRRFLVS
ncbi:YqaJ viral recombinase family protein [Halopseudomonas pelagia]|uniref:Alkaline phosphatase n=1 Tax=Halopseudomonas pelagia TaxID=553151 RepID=A0AA91U266_9GAMM|nr:YqaJ viral recombinase family protein [Halopseudomonas pelagia]PCC99209.1 alkaline phosphatase [Halopseudomonas pelagia]QFY57018.1 alkaline phosphatase [Halopseudomonas pelagia]